MRLRVTYRTKRRTKRIWYLCVSTRHEIMQMYFYMSHNNVYVFLYATKKCIYSYMSQKNVCVCMCVYVYACMSHDNADVFLYVTKQCICISICHKTMYMYAYMSRSKVYDVFLHVTKQCTRIDTCHEAICIMYFYMSRNNVYDVFPYVTKHIFYTVKHIVYVTKYILYSGTHSISFQYRLKNSSTKSVFPYFTKHVCRALFSRYWNDIECVLRYRKYFVVYRMCFTV